MEKFPKLFILAAIGYLLLGVMFGVGLGMGVIDTINSRFIHVHLNLLGFMAMFIYGVAYHILPRFNAKPLNYPSLVGVHFYLVNFGLLGMVFFAHLDGVYGTGFTGAGFVISSIVEAVGIAIFAFNVMPVLLPEKDVEEEEEKEKNEVTGDMKVSHVLDKWPQLLDIFTSGSFKTLANPAARATFAKVITISQACKVHRVDKVEFLSQLNDALTKGVSPATPAPAAQPKQESTQQKAAKAMAKGKQIKRGENAVADTLIGSLIEVYPETKHVFMKHYGEGCFSCPGQAFETLGQTAGMHGIKEEKILSEVNESIKSALG